MRAGCGQRPDALVGLARQFRHFDSHHRRRHGAGLLSCGGTTALARCGGTTALRIAAASPDRTPCGYVLAARDLQTGKPLWQKWIDHDVMSAPVVCIDEVYVVTFAGTLYKFALEDGEILHGPPLPCHLGPRGPGRRHLPDAAGRRGQGMPQECLVKLNRNTGKQLYLAQRRRAPYLADAETRARQAQAGCVGRGRKKPSPTTPRRRKPLPGDPDYVSGNSRSAGQPGRPPCAWWAATVPRRSRPSAARGWRVSTAGCSIGWEASSGPSIRPPARSWGLVLEGLEAGNEAAAGDPAAAPPAVANGKLFVATRSGQLLRIDPTNGRITGRVNLDAPAASQPVIDQGRVLVGTTKGELVCINTGDPALTGWNQWGGDAAHSGSAEAAGASRGADKLPRETGRDAHHPR